jgi:vancomycin permeability regulator SanA
MRDTLLRLVRALARIDPRTGRTLARMAAGWAELPSGIDPKPAPAVRMMAVDEPGTVLRPLSPGPAAPGNLSDWRRNVENSLVSAILGGMRKLMRAVHWRALLHRTVRLGVVVVVVGGLATAESGMWLRTAADGHIYGVEDVPAAPVVLVLGAQVYDDGSPSPFLAARLELARQLYAMGKVKAILVSGDHMDWGYDEPGAMWLWLNAHGVPAGRIIEDHAGFDTYDSCARAKRVFGVDRLIVVTQAFHVERAVALCRHLGVDATGVGDTTMAQFHVPWWRASLREYGAGDKAAWDVLTGRDPVFLGPHETSVEAALNEG